MRQGVLITGANGFIGQHLVNFLSEKGWMVTAMIRRGSVPGFDLTDNVSVVTADLLDKGSLSRVLKKGMEVINLAANAYHPKLSYKVNVNGLANLIEVCKKKGVSRLIQFSSQSVKIKKKGVYAKTKILADSLLRKSGLAYVIVRPSLVYGAGEKGLFNKIKGLVAVLPVIPIFGDGKANVYPVYVNDLCVLVESILRDEKDREGEYDVGSKKAVSYNDVYQKIIGRLGRQTKLIHIPVFMGVWGAKFFELIKLKNPPFYIDNVLGSTQKISCDSSKICKRYKYSLLNYDRGLDNIFNKKRIKLVIVGLGKMGMLHLSILSTFDDVEIVGLVDKNKKSFEMVRSMGAEGDYYESLAEAIKDEKPNGVFIATPTFNHLNLMKLAVKKGVSVFVEKPMVLNDEQINEVKRMKFADGVVVAVGYTLLYKRVFRELSRLIKRKVYGEVRSFKASYEHAEVFGVKRGWMFEKKKAGGGALMNPGPHLFSLLQMFFGRPKGVTGKLKKIYSKEVEDRVSVNLDYGDFEGKVEVNWSVRGQTEPKLKLEVELEKVRLVTDGKIVKVYDGKRLVKTIKAMEIKPFYDKVFNINPEANGEAYYSEDRAFIDAVKQGGGRGLVNNVDFALKSERTIMDCYKNCNWVK